MFNYTVLLYHVTWPDDYLIYDVVTLYSTHLIPTCYLPNADMFILDTWSLTLDIWYCYLICYHLTLDPWDVRLPLDNWHAITYLTCFHMVLVYLTWCCDTCIIFMIITFTGTWNDYYNITIWYSWTPVYLNPWNRETPYIMLLILYSYWSS